MPAAGAPGGGPRTRGAWTTPAVVVRRPDGSVVEREERRTRATGETAVVRSTVSPVPNAAVPSARRRRPLAGAGKADGNGAAAGNGNGAGEVDGRDVTDGGPGDGTPSEPPAPEAPAVGKAPAAEKPRARKSRTGDTPAVGKAPARKPRTGETPAAGKAPARKSRTGEAPAAGNAPAEEPRTGEVPAAERTPTSKVPTGETPAAASAVDGAAPPKAYEFGDGPAPLPPGERGTGGHAAVRPLRSIPPLGAASDPDSGSTPVVRAWRAVQDLSLDGLLGADQETRDLRNARLRRAGTLVGGVALAGVLVYAVFPVGTILDQRAAKERSRDQIEMLDNASDRLEEQAERLRMDEEIERLAREQYGLVMPGEESYGLLPPPEQTTTTVTPPPPPPSQQQQQP